MIPKIRAYVANPQSAFASLQVLGMLIWWLVKDIDLPIQERFIELSRQ